MAIFVAFDMAIYITICIAWVPLKQSIRLPIMVIYIGHLYDYLCDIGIYKDIYIVIWLSSFMKQSTCLSMRNSIWLSKWLSM